MPFLYRCDPCGSEHDLPADGNFDPSEVALNCELCGMDGCPSCIEQCEACGQAACDQCLDSGTCTSCREDDEEDDLEQFGEDDDEDDDE